MIIPLEGRAFGRWTVVSRADTLGSHARWLCRCECGAEKVLGSNVLIHGKSKSCGCWKREFNLKHGHAKDTGHSATYGAWEGMVQRCTNPKHAKYADYGGRGITVCDRWRDFANFLADMGERPDKMELDRIDNGGNYGADNCQWSSRGQQNRNKRNNRMLTFQGETLCLMDWSKRLDINFGTLRNRVNSGWSVERALSTPGQRGGTPEHAQAIADALRGGTLSTEHRSRVREGLRRAYADGTRQPGHLLTSHGETMSLADWSRRTGIKPHTLMKRLSNGWSPEKALETPTRRMKPRQKVTMPVASLTKMSR